MALAIHTRVFVLSLLPYSWPAFAASWVSHKRTSCKYAGRVNPASTYSIVVDRFTRFSPSISQLTKLFSLDLHVSNTCCAFCTLWSSKSKSKGLLIPSSMNCLYAAMTFSLVILYQLLDAWVFSGLWGAQGVWLFIILNKYVNIISFLLILSKFSELYLINYLHIKTPLSWGFSWQMVEMPGFEPGTIALKGRCSTNWATSPRS